MSSRNTGDASIDGILQDHCGSIKILSSKSIGKGDSNLTKVLAIKETLHIYANSDSRKVVLWINNPQEAPWRFRNLLVEIKELKILNLQCKVTHVFRKANEEVDLLGKNGIKSCEDMLQIFG